MKVEEKAWIACALDSEGSITEQNCDIRKPCRGCPHIRIEINNTNREYVDRVLEIVGEGNIHSKPNLPFGTKPCHIWVLCKQKAVLHLLRDVDPYLIIKRAKAREILDRYAKRPVPLRPIKPLIL